jgi:hypothetical protein
VGANHPETGSTIKMDAYENFLQFFSMCNRERLDGLCESYFTLMTSHERRMAFDYLLALVEAGGSEETINGLFIADCDRAIAPVSRLLADAALNKEAQIVAARHLYGVDGRQDLLRIFIHYMADPDVTLREKAAYYVPADIWSDELRDALEAMIRTETKQLARIHAVDKLMRIYGVDEQSVGETVYLDIYRGLRSPEMHMKEAALSRLATLYE